MSDQSAYTRQQWIKAVNLSAFLGWAGVAVPMALQTNFGVLIFAAVIGLPVAFLACWLLGAPILKRRMRNCITWSSAAFWGGLIAFLISFIGSAIGRLYGLWEYLDPTSFSQIGGGDHIQSVDGILTAYGWLILAKSTVKFVVMGVLIAIVVRWVIGPGVNAKWEGKEDRIGRESHPLT